MATFTVTTSADSVDATDGKVSLREALTLANTHADADTITFAARLEGKTLALTRGELDITGDVTITGDPDHDRVGVTINQRTDDLHHFEVAARVIKVSGSGTEALLNGLTVTGGGGHDEEFYGEPVGSGIFVTDGASLHLVDSAVQGNKGQNGAGILAGHDTTVTLLRSSVVDNDAYVLFGWGGGIAIAGGRLDLVQSTVANNSVGGDWSYGGGIAAGFGHYDQADVAVYIAESTITGNASVGRPNGAGGVYIGPHGQLDLANSVVLGNRDLGDQQVYEARDITGSITHSNGHNVLGTVGAGAAPGDTMGVDPAKVFAALDAYGRGQLVLANGAWVVPLRDALDNPALSGADPATAGSADQRGVGRPLPGDTAPDIGAYELKQTHVSHVGSASNDVLTGNAACNTLDGRAGNDLVRGLAGNDTLKGASGSDTLDGGAGNDRLDGGTGTDTVSYATATAGISVSLATTAQQSTGGSGLDTLLNIENLTGSRFVDHLTGNAGANLLLGGNAGDEIRGGAGNDRILGGAGNDWHLEGGLGRDMLTGGSGNDRFDFDTAADSLPTAPDRITDFQGVGAALGDLIDLADLPGTLTFRGIGAFTSAGQVRVGVAGFDTLIEVNLKGDTAPEMAIRVEDGDVAPGQWTAGDFIL